MMIIVVLPHGTFETLEKEKKKGIIKISIIMGITEYTKKKKYQ